MITGVPRADQEETSDAGRLADEAKERAMVPTSQPRIRQAPVDPPH